MLCRKLGELSYRGYEKDRAEAWYRSMDSVFFMSASGDNGSQNHNDENSCQREIYALLIFLLPGRLHRLLIGLNFLRNFPCFLIGNPFARYQKPVGIYAAEGK